MTYEPASVADRLEGFAHELRRLGPVQVARVEVIADLLRAWARELDVWAHSKRGGGT